MINIVKEMSVQPRIIKYLKEILEYETAAGSLESKVLGEELPFVWISTEEMGQMTRGSINSANVVSCVG